jgi:hypothetical protein
MKKPLSSLLTLIFAAALLWPSCTKTVTEEIIEEVCSEEVKAAALVAFYNPFAETIYALPDFLPEAVPVLGLIPSSQAADRFIYQAFTLQGNPLEVQVYLEEADLESLQDMSYAVEAELDGLAYADEGTVALISSSNTRRGYDCIKVGNAGRTRCHVFPGYSTDTDRLDRWICLEASEDDYCTEWKGTVGYSNRYNNQSCSGTPQRTPIRAMTCR